ncbi:MAG: hypothetical protein ACR2NU_02785 [Aeoliella sp.]
MGKEARKRRNREDLDLAPEVREKFEELVALLSAHGFGSEGPPIDTTFAQIEAFGHQAGRMLARAIDEHATEDHSEHFRGARQCPLCETHTGEEPQRKGRALQTVDGDVTLDELACHCPVCDRDFFPSAAQTAD